MIKLNLSSSWAALRKAVCTIALIGCSIDATSNPKSSGLLVTDVNMATQNALDLTQLYKFYRAEDCVSFDPTMIDVTYHSGRWKIAEGSHWIFDFGYGWSGWQEANQSLNILQHYGADQSCFVGRPNPSLTYLLADSAAPQGPFPGEDCISFRRDQLEIRRETSNKWLLTDGRSRMKVFPTADEAYRSEDIIQHYGFNRQCFVGRPGPSLSYFRR